MSTDGDIRERFLLPEQRGDMFVDAKMKRIWKVELDILEEFDRICRKHGLKYSLAGGTLIGAFRHKGFIPWDDDIDVDMVREEYDKFLSVAPKELKSPLFLQTTATDPGRVVNFAQIRNSETAMIDPHWTELGFKFNMGIGIDIFPVDGVPEGKVRRFTTKWIVRLVQSFFYNARIGNPAGLKGKAKRVAAKAILAIAGGGGPYRHREWALRRNALKDCKRCGEISYAISMRNPRLVWPTHCYDRYLDVKFEYLTVMAAAGYDEMNRCQYGDWRTPVKGTGDHGDLDFDTERSYRDVLVEKYGYKKEELS